ncbi:hypothetical protein B0H67DRAFT_39332 [Lasiosphaeris hirsuta]|uniref:Ubiquitin carboxyl-terminal hydrolase n=1 Tax=Lasiosphaeris hirsuta TaxID=260670 RepID=A0AA40BA71_9PEZI|nr:hypothetical protein B0H67DRAFT_39332 [Lasiosphaeris hirsuta]
MPDRSLTVATYAAGASLAAITLIYVFGPTYFLDSDPSTSSNGVFSSRKKGVVGLSNPANDCFINSVLQALAGLSDLRVYLIQETHRRSLDGSRVYTQAVPDDAGEDGQGALGSPPPKNTPEWKVESLQMGIVTKGLKDILDALNERPIYKKTISAGPFIKTLEQAFRQRISRQQQDAQEFLQVVAERLCDEHHAGRRARRFARRKALLGQLRHSNLSIFAVGLGEQPVNQGSRPAPCVAPTEVADSVGIQDSKDVQIGALRDSSDSEKEEGFPLEGSFESQIECLTCGFKPRPTESTFCSLTLNVPQVSTTTLGACFDGMFKTEYIDDFKCEKCRLVHAVSVLQTTLQKTISQRAREEFYAVITKLQFAIETDPEKPPEGVILPDLSEAPKRKIARHIRLTLFPRILAIHLSRSIYDASNQSQKNSAKVSFPEQLPLGGLLQQRRYKLRGLVTHKGNHHSGHYETFRRQNSNPPFSNPNTFQASPVYGKAPSVASTPQVNPLENQPGYIDPFASVPNLPSPESATDSTTSFPVVAILDPITTAGPVSAAEQQSAPTKLPPSINHTKERETDASSLRSVAMSVRSTLPKAVFKSSTPSSLGLDADRRARIVSSNGEPKRRKPNDRWWRISDEKVKEASTRDVLGMQREVYLLFYELDKQH